MSRFAWQRLSHLPQQRMSRFAADEPLRMAACEPLRMAAGEPLRVGVSLHHVVTFLLLGQFCAAACGSAPAWAVILPGLSGFHFSILWGAFSVVPQMASGSFRFGFSKF